MAENRLNRRFHTSIRLQKLVTDITEFKCAEEQKLYLSPIMDLYNGEIISYGISRRPTLDLVLQTLDKAVTIIKHEAPYRTTIHSNPCIISIMHGLEDYRNKGFIKVCHVKRRVRIMLLWRISLAS
ncbi:DDE-type integrase/transposase/recombinase [Mammaliicoccus sciuri]